MHFLDPKNDYAFKQIFGNRKKKKVLISFLNHILDKQGSEAITEVTLLDPRQAPHLKDTKETLLDVHCHDQSGAEYIVEMQILSQDYFDKRALYYASKAYSQQLDSGEDYPELKPVIFLGVLNFNFTEDHHYLSTHLIHNAATKEHILQDFQFTFVELLKFDKCEHELETVTDQWIYFVKNAGKLNAIPQEIREEAVKEAFKVVERALWSKAELALYEASEKRRRDREMETHYSLRQGMEQGRQEEKKQIALNLLHEKVDDLIILQATGLSQEQLVEIKKTIKVV